MKKNDILENYCRTYGAEFPQIKPNEFHYFVTISVGVAEVWYIHGNPKLLGKIIGKKMRNHIVLYVNRNTVTPLTYEMWEQTWDKFFTPKKRSKLPEPNRKRSEKFEIFDTMKTQRIQQKPQNDGFRRTYVANRGMNLMGTVWR